MRHVDALDRAALEHDDYAFNVHLLVGGQVRGGPHELFLVYPQGNPVRATEDAPYLQIGELKYGRPILDRGIRYEGMALEEAAKYALISLDSTMRSNATVGPPIDVLLYRRDSLEVGLRVRLEERDAYLQTIHRLWGGALQKAFYDTVPNPDWSV